MDITGLTTHCNLTKREAFHQKQHQNRPLTNQFNLIALKQLCTKQMKAPEFVLCDGNGLLQLTVVEVHTLITSIKVLALCDSACSHSWIFADLATKLNVKGFFLIKLTDHVIISQQVVEHSNS